MNFFSEIQIGKLSIWFTFMSEISNKFYQLQKSTSNDSNPDVSCCLDRMRNKLNTLCSQLNDATEEKVIELLRQFLFLVFY